MAGHPAIAYLIASNRADELRHEAEHERLARLARNGRQLSLRMGDYRFTIAKEVHDVQCAV